jgi:hypothetical protein
MIPIPGVCCYFRLEYFSLFCVAFMFGDSGSDWPMGRLSSAPHLHGMLNTKFFDSCISFFRFVFLVCHVAFFVIWKLFYSDFVPDSAKLFRYPADAWYYKVPFVVSSLTNAVPFLLFRYLFRNVGVYPCATNVALKVICSFTVRLAVADLFHPELKILRYLVELLGRGID